MQYLDLDPVLTMMQYLICWPPRDSHLILMSWQMHWVTLNTTGHQTGLYSYSTRDEKLHESHSPTDLWENGKRQWSTSKAKPSYSEFIAFGTANTEEWKDLQLYKYGRAQSFGIYSLWDC